MEPTISVNMDEKSWMWNNKYPKLDDLQVFHLLVFCGKERLGPESHKAVNPITTNNWWNSS